MIYDHQQRRQQRQQQKRKKMTTATTSDNTSKLLQFWDEYYLKSNNRHQHQQQEQQRNTTHSDDDQTTRNSGEVVVVVQEWITTPTKDLFDLILSRIDVDAFTKDLDLDPDAEDAQPPAKLQPQPQVPSRRLISVLEIGCGTSTLSRDFYLYYCCSRRQLMVDKKLLLLQQQHNDNDHKKKEDHDQSDIVMKKKNESSASASASAETSSPEQLQQQQQQQQKNHHNLLPKVRATDGSKVCIDTCLKRDQEFLRSFENNNNNDKTIDITTNGGGSSSSCGGLEYEVLDILQRPLDDECGVWDVILDKGCLDTFFFRSRNRGGGGGDGGTDSNGNNIHGDEYSSEVETRGNAGPGGTGCLNSTSRYIDHRAYPPDVRTILDNIWLRLTMNDTVRSGGCKSNTGGEGDERHGRRRRGGGGGVYILISPRRKIKAVRDYGGFVSVEKHIIESPHPCILKQKYSATAENKSSTEEGKGSSQRSTCYMYVCRKNHSYKVGVSDPFPRSSTSKTNDRSNKDGDDDNAVPSDDDECPRCGVTFSSIRKGRDMKRTAMQRLWNGHRRHCKG